MGQKISQTKNHLDISVYLNKYYPNYVLLKILNNGMLSKTVMLLNERDKCPLVAKIFFKSDFEINEIKLQIDKIKETQKKIINESLHNVIPLIYMEEITRSVIVFRQYIEYNLKERIYLMPYLNNIQKIWITLQILYAVNELSELDIVHGDLKPENILLTSNLSVYLSDIATYKPAYISMDDIGNYTYFFGTNKSDSLKGCYFAPERLLDKGETPNNNNKTFAMDVFSVGVIIAELFLEKNIFDFPQLLNYKKNNRFDINETLIPENILNLIKDMIKINPKERISIKDALNRFSNEICPITMTGFLLHFNTLINSTVFWKPDLIIGFIYRYWISLWKMIFGPNDTPAVLYQHLNLAIINKIILENPLMQNFFSGKFIKKEDSEYLYLKSYKLFFDPDSGIINEKSMKELNEKYDKNNNKDCIFIIINFLLQNMQNTKYDSTNLVALEMVKELSKKLDDITKLKLIIPYFVENLKRDSYTTKLVTLNFLFEVLYSFNFKELILPVTEYNYFDSYVFPAILEVYKLENHELILEFLNNVDKIIDLEEKFLNLTLKARLLKIKERYNNKEKENKNMTIEEKKINDFFEEDEEIKEEVKKILKDKRDEIFKDYDSSIEEFKNSLFRVINDLIGEINDIDILISFIRKLPDLFNFYGRSKTTDFSKFIINNFNKTDWIIQKEILCHIPKMMTTLGENTLNEYILPCMEMLIDNNSNEQKTYELIKAIHQLLKMDFLTPKSAVDFFNKLLPFLIHPNLNIKNEMINFAESLISYLSPDESFSYLYKPLSEYITLPPISLTEGIIKKYSIERLNRIAYQLQFRKKDNNNNQNEKNKNKQNDNLEIKLENEYKLQLGLFKSLMDKQKIGNNNMVNNNGEINYSFEGSKEIESYTYLDNYPKHSLKEPIEKYIKKEFSNLTDETEKKALLQKVVYKIFYLSDSTENYNFPYIKDNRNCSFKIGNNILNSELFNIFYILKTLSLSIKSINVNELLHPGNNSRTIVNSPGVHILANYMYNKSFHNWRPQGQIVTTLYDHDKNQVEKLLSLPKNKFCSFDNKGLVNIFKITQNENDDSIIVKKIWYSGNEIQCPIKYRNTIAMLDNLMFLAASENKIYTYNPLYTKETKQIINTFCESNDYSNITCVRTFGKNSLESQKIIMGTEKGGINIYEQRIKKIAISNKIPISNGMINCISESYSENNFYIGTIGGHLLEYDMRLNSIVKDYTYSENTPILGILPYRLTKNSNYDLSSIIKSYNYYVIWTGTYDHEISLWNSVNMHCDLLLKVNTLESRKELRPLTVEIPYLISDYNLEKKELMNKTKKLKKELNSIIKFTHRYDNNFTKSLVLSNLGDKLNEDSYNIFSSMTKLYDNPSTVQCVVSPFCDSRKDIEYDNCSYLLSAGNDMTIRYWDITREGINNNEKKSYLINAPNNLTYCNFTKSNFDKTNILQSNEAFNEPGQRADMPGFSPYLNYNGVCLHDIPQNEFEGDISNLKFCSRISDPSHKSIITDLLPMSIDGGKEQNVLASCSWDGKIKIWK